jgi:spore germination protein
MKKLIVSMLCLLLFACMIPLAQAQTADQQSQWVAKVKVSKTNIYTKPTIRSSVQGTLLKGEAFPVIRSSKYYYKVQLLGGKMGWIRKRHASAVRMQRVVMGWNSFGSTETFKKQIHLAVPLNVVSPRWFTLADNENKLTSSVDPDYIQWAHARGLEIWPLLANRFDATLTNAVIGNAQSREKLVQSLTAELNRYKLDGINIDFENVNMENKADLVRFVEELKKALHPYGIKVSVDVTRHSPDANYSRSYDRAGLGKAADFVVLMGYDEHWAGSPKPGSVSSYPWIREGIEQLLKEVPSHKVILGVPFYTREWVTNHNTNQTTSIDRSMYQVMELMEQKEHTVRWDTSAGQNVMEFKEKDNTHKIWMEDAASLAWRAELVQTYRLQGMAAWALGHETPDSWDAFAKFSSKNNNTLVHKVQSGDTLWKISQTYGLTVSWLLKNNGLSPEDHLEIGQVVKMS